MTLAFDNPFAARFNGKLIEDFLLVPGQSVWMRTSANARPPDNGTTDHGPRRRITDSSAGKQAMLAVFAFGLTITSYRSEIVNIPWSNARRAVFEKAVPFNVNASHRHFYILVLTYSQSAALLAGMVAQVIESTEAEVKQWQENRRIQAYIAEMHDLHVFLRTMEYAGKKLPVMVRSETLEHVTQLLTADLARSKG